MSDYAITLTTPAAPTVKVPAAGYVLPADVKRAYDTIVKKAALYDRLWAYYDGDQPLIYSMERLRKVFQDFKARFSQNWCAVVIDAALDRITLNKFDITNNPTATEKLNKLWQAADMALEAVEVHRAALVTGEGFALVWKDGDGVTEAYSNDPRQCHVFYDDDNPRKASWAAKCWVDGDGYAHLTLYYPDRLEYYISTGKADKLQSAKGFKPDPDEPPETNPFAPILPIFHYRLERRCIKSALASIIEIQDAINKLLADMMVAAEFGAFKQRWIISNVKTKGQFKNAPNEIWDVPSGDGITQDTQVGEFTETVLSNFFDAIDKLVQSIGVISRTPKTFFMVQGGDPSGEALIALEAPLNKKCQSYIDNFIPTWRHLAAFMLELNGETVDVQDIVPQFDKPETVQPRTEAEIRQLNTGAGMPLETTLRVYDNWTDQQLEDMAKDKEMAQANTPPQLAPSTGGGSTSPPGQTPKDMKRQQATDMRIQARQAALGGANGNTKPTG